MNHDELLAALRPDTRTHPTRAVQVETEDGLNTLLYRPTESGEFVAEGALIVPRALLDHCRMRGDDSAQ
ncbi:hypothetical protein OHA04_27615 [Streptomyces sp. NBC_01590]|uniref:hypothetical protein n=1 Tax=Streptomyces sp. NBC_01590 TaxID=2975887 RepID=UPI003867C8E7